jgi:hypothetical protein
MNAFEEVMALDNAYLKESEGAEAVTYHRPSTGAARDISAIIERGVLSRDKDIRSEGEARRRTGRVFLFADEMTEFEGRPEPRDEIADKEGRTWTVLQEISRDGGVIEAAVETDVRPVF